jgi:AAA domain
MRTAKVELRCSKLPWWPFRQGNLSFARISLLGRATETPQQSGSCMALRYIEIEGFRGIPQKQTIQFVTTTLNGKSEARSLILFGDNGTGKSSVVDAIEFALQGRIGRSKDIDDIDNAYPTSLFDPNKCNVRAGMTNGSEVERSIARKDEDIYISEYNPHPLFSISPFVLRRNDVLKFHETPEDQRQTVFFDFFMNPSSGWPQSPKEQFDHLISMRRDLKERRLQLRERVADLLHWDIDSIPAEKEEINSFISMHFYRGLTKKRWKYAVYNGEFPPLPADTQETLTALVQTIEDYGTTSSSLRKLRKYKVGVVARPAIKEALNRISEDVTRTFLLISNAKHIKSLIISHGDISQASLSIDLQLQNDLICKPKQVLSEANLDLLALLLYITLMKESARRGQSKFVILDDVFQSIDSTIRLSIMDMIVSEMNEWQFLITVHDRLWKEQIRELFRRRSHPFFEQDIVRWNFGSGPVFRDGGTDMEDLLLDSLNQGDPLGVCSRAGVILEAICNTLSWTLPVSVTRRRDDKYTLGDLLPAVAKKLKKTSCSKEILEIEKWAHLRNLVGAHFNSWASLLSDYEANSFGHAVVDLLRAVKCKVCGSWIEPKDTKSESYRCKCGKIQLIDI